MYVDLVSSPRDIKSRWGEVSLPLEFLLSINLYEKCSWRFILRFLTGDRVDLRIIPECPIDLLSLLNGFFPKLLNSERILVSQSGADHNLQFFPRDQIIGNPGTLRLSGELVDFEIDSGIEFQNLFPSRFYPEYTNNQEIRKFLLLRTWMGSHFVTPSKYLVTLEAGQSVVSTENETRTQFYCSGVRNGEPEYRSTKVDLNRGISAYNYSNSAMSKVHLFSRFGDRFSQSSKPLQEILEACTDLPAGYFEFDSKKVVYTNDHKSDCLEDPAVVIDLVRSTVLGEEYQTYLFGVEQLKREREVALLDERKEKLQRESFVFFRDNFVFKKPTSEIEVVILHSKLEAMGGLPYAEYVSLEYTPKLGIDAISDFKIRTRDQLRKFTTVEYEFKFSSYFRHGHAIEQTDLVICWKIDSFPRGSLTKLDKNWIFEFDDSGERMLVAEIERYPEIEIRSLL